MAIVSPGAAMQAQQTPEAAPQVREQLESARRLFEALEWESALPQLDAVVNALSAQPSSDPAVRALLVTALELRARTRFGLGNRDGTRQDLASLLALAPGHALPANVAAGVSQIFDEVRRTTVGTLVLAINPADAVVTIDGTEVEVTGPVPVAAGLRRVVVARGGYRPAEREVEVLAGAQQAVDIVLDRVSARIVVFTSPPGVEVWLDGTPRGTTPPGPVPEAYADVAAGLGVPPERVSGPLILDDVAPGERRFELRKSCYVPVETTRSVPRPTDLRLDIKLDLAAATVRVESSMPGAEVLLNGEPRGKVPLVISEVCEGPQVIELVAPAGRYLRRFDARANESIDIRGDIAPAVAVVSVSAPEARYRGEDLRLLAERWFASAKTLAVFAPPEADMAAALREQQLGVGWLAFGPDGRPLGPESDLSPAVRREAVLQMVRRFGAQGVAGVGLLPGPEPRAVVSLLAAGSGEPDVFEVPLANPEAWAGTLAGLEVPPAVLFSSLDLVAVDVIDVPGAVVVGLVPGGEAARAGLAPGEAVVEVHRMPVRSLADLERVLAEIREGPVAVTVRTPTGGTRSVNAAVVRRPRVVSVGDRMTAFNKLALDLRFRLAAVNDPLEESALRLNLAVALLRLGNWSDARRELQRVSLADGPGVSTGTVQYLLGLTYEAGGQLAEAEQAFRAAAAVEGSLLTEIGPAIADLVRARSPRR